MDAVKFLANPIVTLVIGCVVTVIFAYLPQYGRRRTKELCWGIWNNNLIRDYHGQLPDLEVLYRRQHVENLSVAHLTIWSSGSGPIRGNDIAPADPLVVEARQGTAILDVTAIGLNNPPSQLSIVPRGDGHVLEIAFDFLEHGQGGVFQIVHTGIAGFNLGVCGHIIGGNVRERWVDVDGLADLGNAASIPTSTKRFTMLGYGLFGLFTLLMAIFLPLLWSSPDYLKAYPMSFWNGAGEAFFVLLMLTLSLHFFLSLFRTYRDRTPKGLARYETRKVR